MFIFLAKQKLSCAASSPSWILIIMIEGILYTLGVEFVLVIILFCYELRRQLKEDYQEKPFRFWEDT